MFLTSQVTEQPQYGHSADPAISTFQPQPQYEAHGGIIQTIFVVGVGTGVGVVGSAIR